MFSKKKKKNWSCPPTEISQIDLVCKSFDWFLNNRQTLQGKGFIYNFKNCYVFATSACTFNYLPVSCEFGFEAFYVWFIFDRVWNLIPKMGSMENKGVCTVF